jgi:hypothetical protein
MLTKISYPLYNCALFVPNVSHINPVQSYFEFILILFGPRRDEVTGEWRKLHNDLYCSRTIVRVIKSRIRLAGHVAQRGEGRSAYRVLVGKPEGKRPLRRPRCRRRIILRCLQEVGCGFSWLGIETGGGHL